MLHARPAWGAGGTARGRRRARRPPPPPALRALVEDCWAPEADQRPGFVDVCARLEACLGADAAAGAVARGCGCAVM
jgi:hypothetical protein